MRRRFVIGVDGLTADQEKTLREYIASLGAWWHWIGNLWLLTTTSSEVTTNDIIDRIQNISGTVKAVVFEFSEDIDWTATGQKNAAGKSLYEWLKSPWGDK